MPRMDPANLAELRSLIADAASSLTNDSPKEDAIVQEVTPEGYALLMRAPDLAQELLQERDALLEGLTKIQQHLVAMPDDASHDGIYEILGDLSI